VPNPLASGVNFVATISTAPIPAAVAAQYTLSMKVAEGGRHVLADWEVVMKERISRT
jgi:hypothetical protein